MNTKLTALLAASTLALAACGGSDVETAEAEYEDGAVETALSEEQPPLEGDSPAVDDTGLAATPYGAGDADELSYETASLSETYTLDIDGLDESRELTLDTDAQTAMLDGETYLISMDGDRFSFDAPTTVDGEEQLMTYSGLYRDGMIEDGVIEAQGDGASMTYTAERVEAEIEEGMNDVRRGVSETYEEGRAELDELGNEIEATGEEVEQAGENAYDRATDGSDATEALDPVDED